MGTWRNRRAIRAVIAALVLGGGVLATGATASATKPSPAVVRAEPALTIDWWRAMLSRPASADPLESCSNGTDHLIFLSGTTGGTAERSCTITARTRLLVPLINAECSKAEGLGDTNAELRACAKDFADAFTDLRLRVDGVDVAHLSRLRTASDPFVVTATADNVFAVPAGTTRAVADGYWAVIGPFSPGKHKLTFGGTYPPGPFTTLAEYTLTVRP
jgi:hypothetical protein